MALMVVLSPSFNTVGTIIISKTCNWLMAQFLSATLMVSILRLSRPTRVMPHKTFARRPIALEIVTEMSLSCNDPEDNPLIRVACDSCLSGTKRNCLSSCWNKIQDSRFKIFIGITGQQVSFANRQDNIQNINTKNPQKHIKWPKHMYKYY